MALMDLTAFMIIVETMNKEIQDALCMLLHCAKNDKEFTTQQEQFKLVVKYILKLENDNRSLRYTIKAINKTSKGRKEAIKNLMKQNSKLKSKISILENKNGDKNVW